MLRCIDSTTSHTVYKVSKKHLYFSRPLSSRLQLLQRDVRILCKLLPSVLWQNVRPLLPATFVRLHAPIYRGSFCHEPANWLSMPAGGGKAIAQTLASARAVSKQLAKDVSHNGRIHGYPLCLWLFLTGHDNLTKDRMFLLSYWGRSRS